ncbi:calponin-likey domain-containing protein [Spatholobus suberectus]|nr:calponin-likey domain-containing protein [Spatholobus suberectus]
MGFNSVYRSLQEIFPQVDARLLRAVAIEHPKDADQAAGIVLAEIIPFVSKKLPPATPPQDNGHGAPLNVEVESEAEGNRLRHRQLVDDIDVGPSSAPHSISVEITKTADYSFGLDLNVSLDKSTLSNGSNSNNGTDKFLGMDDIKELNIFQNAEDNFNGETSNKIAQEMSNGFSQEDNENFDQRQLHVDVDCENLISGLFQEMEPEHNYLSKEAASTDNNGNRIGNHLNEEWVDFVGPSADDYDAAISHRVEECETNLIEVESSEAQADCHVQGNTLNSKDGLQSEWDAGSSSADGKTSDVEDDIVGQNAVSQYSQVCRIDLLEEIIDEAKTNKKTLFSSMESLINLMREVELQEKAAEQANMEAATGGSNILARVEEYKTMLVQANEANDMHAGEVYGEKAILATELKELQSRLLSLSDERDKSLAILDEMHQILEARLAAAEELRKAAEHEKLEKEETAQKALVEQETLVEKVVHESERLQQEAEENSKLREFLMDRGRVVDMLQGEISVICQDIRLLKEKFDANLPLSKSFTSSQTSCKLASSGSSHKTLASDVGSEHSDSSEIGKTSRAASIESLSSKSGHDEEKSKADHNALLDDGWDIFEKDDAELNS